MGRYSFTGGLGNLTNIDKEEAIDICRHWFNKSKKISILTGAGMSTDSGIPDFRSNTGIYSSNPSNILSINNFKNNPKSVYNLLNKYFIDTEIKPNKGHYLIKYMEDLGKEIIVCTQNIDGLHTESGIKQVYEMHGTVKTSTCMKCNKKVDTKDICLEKISFNCDCGGLIKPDVVLFGENIKHFSEATMDVYDSDLLIVLGTSLNVFPVCEILDYTKKTTPIIIITNSPTPYDDSPLTVKIEDDITNTLKKIVDNL